VRDFKPPGQRRGLGQGMTRGCVSPTLGLASRSEPAGAALGAVRKQQPSLSPSCSSCVLEAVPKGSGLTARFSPSADEQPLSQGGQGPALTWLLPVLRGVRCVLAEHTSQALPHHRTAPFYKVSWSLPKLWGGTGSSQATPVCPLGQVPWCHCPKPPAMSPVVQSWLQQAQK